MAFGKETAGLKRVGSFRESTHVSQSVRPKRTGGGALRWLDRFQPSVTEPDKIRFIPGEYQYDRVNENGELESYLLEYERFTEHFDGKTKTSTICSAGPFANFREKKDPCIGCDLFWENPKKGGRMSRRDMYSFTILNYATFHHMEQLDRLTGQVRINDKTKQPWMEWVQCKGRRCDMCTAGKETKKGHVQHYELGYGHFSQLSEYAEEIGKCCRNCRQKNVIEAVAYLCTGCKDAVIDMDETTLDDKDIKKMIHEDVVCPQCRHKGLLEEIITCRSCGDPKRADIFDVDLSFKRAQVDPNSNQTSLLFTGFGEVCPVDVTYAEVAKPLDLSKLYVPDSLETQATKFKAQVAAGAPAQNQQRQPVPASQVTQPYSPPAPQTQQAAPPTGGGSMFRR